MGPFVLGGKGGLWVLLIRDKTLERFHRRGAESEDPSWLDLPRPGPLDRTEGGANERGGDRGVGGSPFPLFLSDVDPFLAQKLVSNNTKTMLVRWEGDGWSDRLLSILFRGDQGKGRATKVGGKRKETQTQTFSRRPLSLKPG